MPPTTPNHNTHNRKTTRNESGDNCDEQDNSEMTTTARGCRYLPGPVSEADGGAVVHVVVSVSSDIGMPGWWSPAESRITRDAQCHSGYRTGVPAETSLLLVHTRQNTTWTLPVGRHLRVRGLLPPCVGDSLDGSGLGYCVPRHTCYVCGVADWQQCHS